MDDGLKHDLSAEPVRRRARLLKQNIFDKPFLADMNRHRILQKWWDVSKEGARKRVFSKLIFDILKVLDTSNVQIGFVI